MSADDDVVEAPIRPETSAPHHLAQPGQRIVAAVAREIGVEGSRLPRLRIGADAVDLDLGDLDPLDARIEVMVEREAEARALHRVERVEVLRVVAGEEFGFPENLVCE